MPHHRIKNGEQNNVSAERDGDTIGQSFGSDNPNIEQGQRDASPNKTDHLRHRVLGYRQYCRQRTTHTAGQDTNKKVSNGHRHGERPLLFIVKFRCEFPGIPVTVRVNGIPTPEVVSLITRRSCCRPASYPDPDDHRDLSDPGAPGHRVCVVQPEWLARSSYYASRA